MISRRTQLIAHLGYPTASFKVPMIDNPWFERKGIDAIVRLLEAGTEVAMMRPKRSPASLITVAASGARG